MAAKIGAALAGELRVLVVPILYADSKMPFEEKALADRLFGAGSGDTVSYSGYWSEVSGGLLDVSGTVTSWVRLPREAGYYLPRKKFGWASFGRTTQFRQEALRLIDGALDFGQFDNDGADGLPNSGDDDGFVDFVIFVYAMPCKGDQRSGAIWPHRGAMSPYRTQTRSANGSNIQIADYLVLPAVDPQSCGPMHVGVLAHETGHALGLPDLYDYDGSSQGIGAWGLMGTGSHSARFSPSHLSAWEKEQLGWVRVDWITSSQRLVLPSVESAHRVQRFDLPEASGAYLLLENRQSEGSDRQLPGNGMLVWRIDPERAELGAWNSDERRMAVGLIQADGKRDLEKGVRADSGDPFPGVGERHRFDYADGGALRLSGIHIRDGSIFGEIALGLPNPEHPAAPGVLRITALEGTRASDQPVKMGRRRISSSWTGGGTSSWLRTERFGDLLMLRADATALLPGEYADTLHLRGKADDDPSGKLVVDFQVAAANGHETVASDLPWSWGLAARDGRILQASYGWDPLGLRPRPRVLQLLDGQTHPSTLARVPSEALYAPVLGPSGETYVLARARGRNFMYRVEANGNAAIVASDLGDDPMYGAAPLPDGSMLVADYTGRIRRVTKDGVTTWRTVRDRLYQIAADSAGNVYAATFNGYVLKIGVDGREMILQTGFEKGRLVAVATTPEGDVYVAERGGSGRILRLSRNGGTEVVARVEGAQFYGLAVDGRFLYAADIGHRQLIRFALPRRSSVVANASD
jgi:M6 family metalloprotease-like protein